MHEELFNMLRTDHEMFKKLLTEIDELSERSVKKKETLFARLRGEIVPHMKAEEKAFYAPLLEDKKAKDDTLEGLEEHHAAEMVLKELIKLPVEEERWPAKLSVFKEMVEHHIEEEEGNIFQLAEEALTHEQIDEILQEFNAEKSRISKRLTRSNSK